MIRKVLLLCVTTVIAGSANAQVHVESRGAGPVLIHNRGSWGGISRSATRPGLSRSSLAPTVSRHASRVGIDPDLVHAVIRAESDYNPWAVSSKGAVGLMQLMPETQRDYRVSDPYDPEQNVAAGSAYLKRLLDQFEDSLELALAAYNAGPETVRRYGGVPPFDETRRYLERVLSDYRPGRQVRWDAVPPGGGGSAAPGRKTYVFRDGSGRLVMSTSPPAPR